VPSRAGDTLSDRAALHVLKHIDPSFKRYSWLDRGSDERQYCAPGVDLPIASITRSKYVEYPEYHTSLDDLDFVTPAGLQGGFDALRQAIEVIENDWKVRATVLCEPQLGKRGLYPTLGTKESGMQVRAMMNFITYADGTRTILEIADLIGESHHRLVAMMAPLADAGLIELS
jgi:aminopeptidase-like protein